MPFSSFRTSPLSLFALSLSLSFSHSPSLFLVTLSSHPPASHKPQALYYTGHTSNSRMSSSLLESEVDLYSLLNVKRDAEPQQIRAMYRLLSSYLHPDKLVFSSDEEKREISPSVFIRLKEAYDILGDATKRSVYDEYGMRGIRALGRVNTPLSFVSQDPLEIVEGELSEEEDDEEGLGDVPSVVEAGGNMVVFLSPKGVTGTRIEPTVARTGTESGAEVGSAPLDASFKGSLTRRSTRVASGVYFDASKQVGKNLFEGSVDISPSTLVNLAVSRELVKYTTVTVGAAYDTSPNEEGLPPVSTNFTIKRVLDTTEAGGASAELRWDLRGKSVTPSLSIGKQISKKTRLSLDVALASDVGVEVGFRHSISQLVSSFATVVYQEQTLGIQFGTLTRLSMLSDTRFRWAVNAGPNGVFLALALAKGDTVVRAPIHIARRTNRYTLSVATFLPLIGHAVCEIYRRFRRSRRRKQRLTSEGEAYFRQRQEAIDTQTRLEPLAASIKEREILGDGLVILKAVYGDFEGVGASYLFNNDGEEFPRYLDVTIALQAMVNESSLDLPEGKKTVLPGFCECTVGVSAGDISLFILYKYRNIHYRVLVPEQTSLSLPHAGHMAVLDEDEIAEAKAFPEELNG